MDHLAQEALVHKEDIRELSHPDEGAADQGAGKGDVALRSTPGRFRRFADDLDAVFASEATDVAWSRGASAVLESRYSSPEFKGLRADARCASTLCRVSLEFEEEANVEHLTRMVSSSAPWSAPAVFDVDLETRRGSYFLARESFSLPLQPE